ncbi:MAG: ABC transporter ATP-binding protein [Haloarculaceae archaeon]
MTLRVDLRARFVAPNAEPFTVVADLSVSDDETLVVLGPSGSGKTLLLETIAGFHDHEGTVDLDGRALTDLPPEDRGFGFVFQDYALFPHLTARENVAFGQRYRESSRDADELLEGLGVGHLADRYPPTLSGGERQRVALARALAVDPALLLLDEPLSALDVPTRQSLRADLQDVLDELPAVYVTHNRTTARALADRIVVLHEGRVVQTGDPDAVFERPNSPLVARFTGSNCVPISAIDDGGERFAGVDGSGEHLAIRPEHVVLDGADPDLTAAVERVVREDVAHRVTLSGAGITLDAFAAEPPRPGERVAVTLPRERVVRC